MEWTEDLDQEVTCNGSFVRQGGPERQNNSQCQSSQGEGPHSRGLTAACEGDEAFAPGEQDLQMEGAVHTIQRNTTKTMCKTCGIVKESHHFYVTDPERCFQP